MKVTTATTLALAAAMGAHAQSSSVATAPSVVTKYEYYDDCPTSTGPNYGATVTGTIISTYCPECSDTGIYTTYTTVYKQWCPTGLEDKIYTVTESCSELGQQRDATYVPQGFTVVTESCSICQHPTTAVITSPCSATAAATSTPTVYAAPVLPSASAAPAATGSASAPVAAAPTVYGASVETETLVPGTPSAAAVPKGNTTISPPIQKFQSGAVSSSPAGFVLLAGVALYAATQYAF